MNRHVSSGGRIQTVAVAGATGHAGKHIIEALAAAGIEVRALVRDSRGLGSTENFCREIRIVQVTDRDSLRGSLNGVDGLISAVGKTRQRDKVDRRIVDVDANRNLFEEAALAGVKKVGFVSVAGASKEHPAVMMRMKAEAEDALRRTNIPYLIVQPSGYFSDLWGAFEMCRRGFFICLGDGGTLFNPISLRDLGDFVASEFLNASSVDVTRPVGGPQVLRMADLATISETIVGRRVRTVHVPLWLAEKCVNLIKPFSRNAWELAQFFVGTVRFAEPNGGSMVVSASGRDLLKDYFISRYRGDPAIA